MKKKINNREAARWAGRRGRVIRSIERSRRPRLTVFRSARHIYAQLIDGDSGRTIGTASTRSKDLRADLSGTGNVDAARKVGARIAALAQENGIEEVVFNRNGFLFHGRVKALAEAAREAGLRF